MADFWDHLFNALGHVADAQRSAGHDDVERRGPPKRRIKAGARPSEGSRSFDGPSSAPADPSCCVTSRRTVKLE